MLKTILAGCAAAFFLALLMLSVSRPSLAAQARALTLDYDNMSSVCYEEDAVRPFPERAALWISVMDDYWSTATTDNYIRAYKMADDSKWSGGLDHTSVYVDNGDATTFWSHGGVRKVGGSSTYNRFRVRLSTDYNNPYSSVSQCMLGVTV